MSPYLSEACHRTRQQISLRLDSKLSEFEEALVAAHLAHCAACCTFADDLRSITETLRSTPLAVPAVGFELPRRPSRVGVAFAGSAAAAAMSVAGAVIVGISVHTPASRIPAADIQLAHKRLVLQERLTESMGSTAPKPARQVPMGVRAAEESIVGSGQGG